MASKDTSPSEIARRVRNEQELTQKLYGLASMYAELAEEEWRWQKKAESNPSCITIKRGLHNAQKSSSMVRDVLFKTAGLDIQGKSPDMYIRHVLWRVAAAEEKVRRGSMNTPLVTTMPATMLVSLGVDVTPDRAWEFTRKNNSASVALISVMESQFAE